MLVRPLTTLWKLGEREMEDDAIKEHKTMKWPHYDADPGLKIPAMTDPGPITRSDPDDPAGWLYGPWNFAFVPTIIVYASLLG